jgi:hypothetical protein
MLGFGAVGYGSDVRDLASKPNLTGSKYINGLTVQMNDIMEKLTQELKAQGIEL